MRNFIDPSGRRYGKWLVLGKSLSRTRPVYWTCQCICGAVRDVQAGSLKNGTSTSCCSCARTSHGEARSSTYRCWVNMRQRCKNVKHPQYKDYGGRGIAVCEEWATFKTFFEDMGRKPERLSLERVDNNAGYCKSNCIWATKTEQVRNSRTSKLTVSIVRAIRASTLSSAELARKYCVTPANVWLVRTNKTWRNDGTS